MCRGILVSGEKCVRVSLRCTRSTRTTRRHTCLYTRTNDSTYSLVIVQACSTAIPQSYLSNDLLNASQQEAIRKKNKLRSAPTIDLLVSSLLRRSNLPSVTDDHATAVVKSRNYHAPANMRVCYFLHE